MNQTPEQFNLQGWSVVGFVKKIHAQKLKKYVVTPYSNWLEPHCQFLVFMLILLHDFANMEGFFWDPKVFQRSTFFLDIVRIHKNWRLINRINCNGVILKQQSFLFKNNKSKELNSTNLFPFFFPCFVFLCAFVLSPKFSFMHFYCSHYIIKMKLLLPILKTFFIVFYLCIKNSNHSLSGQEHLQIPIKIHLGILTWTQLDPSNWPLSS